MSGIKQLAGQTLWYGASSIFARFLNYALTPYLTYVLTGPAYGEMSLVYAAIPFLNAFFLYGMETAYFRYSQQEQHKNNIYNTASVSLISTTLLFTFLLILFNKEFAALITVKEHPEYITFAAFIIAFDSLSALPFAKLRHEGRPRKFAFIRIGGIVIYMALVYFFLSVCPAILEKDDNSFLLIIYNKDFGVGYIIIANLAQAIFQFVMLRKEFFSFQWKFDFIQWKAVMIYAIPIGIAGFAGIINETFDRIMLGWWSPATSVDAARLEVGAYSACYKLSILISLFIQAFRMGAEPFFFRQSNREDAPKIYARVMKFFVLTITVMFLVVALYLDLWKTLFIKNEALWSAISVVPILLFANMFLGIYINLSVWYKLSDRTMTGAYITFIGAGITLLINYFFIPLYSFYACAWATFFCYGSMMVISYVWGQKNYPIPYAWKKLLAYIVIVTILYFIHRFIISYWQNTWLSLGLATLLVLAYVSFVVKVERKEFRKLPVVGRYL